MDAYLEYAAAGWLQARYPLKEGRLHGEALIYNQDGQVVCRAHFKDGQLDGDAILYDDHGWVTQKMHYKDGKPDGESALYIEGTFLATFLLTRQLFCDRDELTRQEETAS